MNRVAEDPHQVVDLHHHHDRDLLHRVYSELYLPSFPFPEEREDLDQLERLLWNERSPDDPVGHFLVAGRNLTGPNPDARAIAASEFYGAANAGLLTYIAVAPHARNEGLARLLLDETRQALANDSLATGDRLAAIFAEIHDPARMSETGDAMDPRARVSTMARLGGRRVPIPYVQPELASGRGRSNNLMLIAFSADGGVLESLPSDVVVDFLHALYRALGVAEPRDDADFARTVGAITGSTIDLVELV